MARRQRPRARSRKAASPGRVLVALLILLVFYLYQTGELQRIFDRLNGVPSAGNPPGQSAPQAGQAANGQISAFFTTPSLVYPDRRNQRGPSPLLQAVIADIDAAERSVDVAAFDFDVPEFTDALLRAAERGAAVRVVIDSENLETPEVAEETGRLQDADVPVEFDDREPFMHNKFVVLDSAVTWTGSWNITSNDTFRNNNNMLRIVSSEIAANYAREFEQMFEGTFGKRKASDTPNPVVQIGGVQVETYFSPEDGVAQHVLERLEQAERSIRFMTFSYTSDPIADTMIARLEDGLTVQGVFEGQNAGGTGSEFQKLRQAGVDVLEDGNCYILHHKTIIVDERIVITGSYNFTASAERDNDENLLIIDDPALARSYLDEFERTYDQAQNPTRCG